MSNPSKPATPRCAGHTSAGEPCKKSPVLGATVCATHGARAPQVRAKAAVRAELIAWGLDDAADDPGEVLLRLVTQSARRAALYAGMLQDAYEAAERLAAAEKNADVTLGSDARRDLDEVLSRGGVAVLVGKTYGAAGKDGHIFATGEAIRGLALLEATERDRCANFAAKAVAAGLAERQVRLAERLGGSLVTLIDGLVSALGHDPADPKVRQLVQRQLQAIEGGQS